MATIPANDPLDPSSDEPIFDKAILEDDKVERSVLATSMSNSPITFPDGGFRAWLVVFGVRHSASTIDSC